MARFRRVAPTRYERDGAVDEFEVEVRPGHVVRRVDCTTTLGAGRKGRAASVSVHRELTCSCGGSLRMGGLTVAEDLANLRHFESPEEREAYEEENARLRESILRNLAGKGV